MTTDEKKYGGLARVVPGDGYRSETLNGVDIIKMYVPSRCAIVLAVKK